MEAPSGIVIGIDGGGTFTRALAADLEGHPLAYVEAGAASRYKDPAAEQNVRDAITAVLDQAGCAPGDVVGLVAGMAGVDSPADEEWACRATDVPGLGCPRRHLNDAVVAHAGAFGTGPGIIVVGGTGAIIFGIAPDGRQIRNYDFHQYAATAARQLAYETTFRILAGQTTDGDAAFVAEVLAFWEVESLDALRSLGMDGFITDGFARTQRFGEMGPLVTSAAERGIPVARAACDHAVNQVVTGIGLVGACLLCVNVPVALIGGAVRSAYVQRTLRGALAREFGDHYRLQEPRLPGAAGAVLLALELAGAATAPAEENLRSGLSRSIPARPVP